MQIDIGAIRNARVRVFYSLYWPQHRIICDFYSRLTEEQFDYRMVDTPGRKADTPRESLAHILEVQWMYFEGVKAGKIEFRSMGLDHYRRMAKAQLLAELERVDAEMHAYLTAPTFDSEGVVDVPWGSAMNAVDALFFLRDHDILHVGWNLAVMDHLDVPRFESLAQYWGP